MVLPEIADGVLSLRVEGADRVWAFKSELRIPLPHVAGVRLDAEIVREWWHGLRELGTDLPRVITAGTFLQGGKRVFWDIHHPEQAVVISLHDETYNELVIQVEDAEGFVRQLKAAI